MNRAEFSTFANVIKTYYPKEIPNKQSMALWFRAVEDLPYKVACQALENHYKTSQYKSVTPANVREGVKNLYWQMLEEKTGDEFIDLYQTIMRLEQKKSNVAMIEG